MILKKKYLHTVVPVKKNVISFKFLILINTLLVLWTFRLLKRMTVCTGVARDARMLFGWMIYR
jgi:hypothetical protein